MTALANIWMDESPGKEEIYYIAQINTGTLNMALKLAENGLIADSHMIQDNDL